MQRRPSAVLLSLLLFFIAAGPIESLAQAGSKSSESSLITGKGLYNMMLVPESNGLVVGPNNVNLTVRDRDNKPVTGAEISITPWMPEHGHGVWEKPVISDRGNGNYRAENIVLIMAGKWDLKVSVRKGPDADLGVFSFVVGTNGPVSERGSSQSKEEYVRTTEYYKIPNVTLLNQDGKRVNLRSMIESGKPVVIDFIYTTCTTICPVLSAAFANLQDELGANTASAQLISISLDPEYDRPEQMKEYLSRYEAKEGWDFLTGTREEITLVLRAFDASVKDKMAHRPLYLLHGPNADHWVRILGLIGSADFMREFRKVEGR